MIEINENNYTEIKKAVLDYETKETCKGKVCGACGKPATTWHMSIMGQIKFFVCEEHYKTHDSAMGGGSIGLVDKEGNFIDLHENSIGG